MVIPDMVRQSMQKGIRENIEGYKNWIIDHNRGKQMWRYKNEVDFWYGHMIGSLIALSYVAFKKLFGRLPNDEEQQEIQEMLLVHGTEIREIVSNWG